MRLEVVFSNNWIIEPILSKKQRKMVEDWMDEGHEPSMVFVGE